MREILFRGKSKRSGEWLFGDYEHFYAGNDLHAYISDWGETFEEVVTETVGQFTGLTDKNGKKIFEGDILETEDRIVVVTWHSASACWDSNFVRYTDGERWTGTLANQWSRWASVIGNIHDNRELIENENPAIL